MDCLTLLEPVSLVNQLVSGVALGGVYALVGIGLVLIYKTSRVMSFVQGDLLMWGAYTAFALVSIGLPFPIAALGALLIAAFGGLAIERVLLRRIVGQPTIVAIIVTLGLSSLLRGLAYLLAGTDIRRFPGDVLPGVGVGASPVTIAPVYVWSLAMSVGAVIALIVFFRFSRLGIALRAAADDQQAARSMGIRISSMLALSWALAAVVAAIGGVLLANLTGINFTLADFGLLVVPVVILGGLDSLPGAIAGGFMMGVLQNVATGYLDPCVGGGLNSMFPYLVLLGILLIRPHGLFGSVRIERV